MTTIKIKRGTGVPTSLAEGEMAVDVGGSAVYVNAKATSGATDNIIRVGNEIVDDDTFATASATTVPSSESVKAYVDNNSGVTGLTSTATSTRIELSDAVTKFTNDIELHHPSGNKIEFFTATAPASQAKGEIVMNGDTQMFLRTGLLNAAQIVLDSANGGSTTFQSPVTFDTAITVDDVITIAAPLQVNSSRSTLVIGSNAGATLSSTNNGLNTLIGFYAGNAMTTGFYNTAVGAYSMDNCTIGQRNTALGYGSNNGLSPDFNTAVGHSALNQNNGSSNTAVGYNAGTFNTSGEQNVFIGSSAGWQNNTDYNTAVGHGALDNTQSAGEHNVAVGWAAGGGGILPWVNYDDCVFVGSGSGGAWPQTLSNVIVIGRNAMTSVSASGGSASNEITLGNSSITSLRCNVTSITSLSDMRDKTNIADLSGASNFIKNLEPVSYDWARRDESMQGERGHGFLAQQLKSAQEDTGYHIPGLVFDNNPDKLEAAYGNLLPTVVAALKDALTEIDELKAKVAALESA